MRRMKLLFITMASFFSTLPAWAHGDKVIPQVVDGTGAARTKFDITNLSPDQKVTRIKVLFFLDNGSPWSIPTNRGTVSEVSLNLGPFQTIRIETLGTTQNLTAGYAIVRNSEITPSVYPENFDVAVTVFYEILSGPNVIDTVSVPLGEPTLAWILPVEFDADRNLWTGFAVVNLTDGPNKVTLRLWEATEPLSGDPADGGTREFTLNAKEHRARFLTQEGLFTDKRKFKGAMVGFSEKPVAILALLQTPTPTGVQYATLVQTPFDSLRRNTYTYLRQGFALNADLPVVDYFFSEKDSLPPGYDDFTWDLRYETQSGTARRLAPRNGASIAVVGLRNDMEFDALSIEQIQSLTYTTNPIDMSDGASSLATQFAFAIRTDLGRFVKVRIADVITRDTNRDLALEVFIYK